MFKNRAEKIVENEIAGKKEAVLTSEQENAKEEMISCLSAGKVYEAFRIKDNFNLPEETVQPLVEKEMMELMSYADIYRNITTAIEIKDLFNLPEEFIQSVAQAGMKQCFIHITSGGAIISAVRIKDNFNLPEEVVQSMAKEEMMRCFTKGYLYDALKIKINFNLSEEIIQSAEVQSVIKEGAIRHLVREAMLSDAIIKIKDEFNLSEEVLRSAAEEALLANLDSGQVDRAAKIRIEFNINIKKPELFDKINNLNPDLYYQFEKISQQLEEKAFARREEERKRLENSRAEKKRNIQSIIMELRDPIMGIMNQLKSKINRGEYDLIVGEDVSGRIPTLIFERIIKNIYREKKFPNPKTVFFAGSGGGLNRDHEQAKIEGLTKMIEGSLKEKSNKGNDSKAGESKPRVLVVTEYIETGRSLEPLVEAIRRSGIDFDIAALEIRDNMRINLQEKFGGKITHGNRTIKPVQIFYNKHLSGTTKKSWDVHSRPIKKALKERPELKNDQEFPRHDPFEMKIAREAAKNLADDITSWYKRN